MTPLEVPALDCLQVVIDARSEMDRRHRRKRLQTHVVDLHG